MTKAERQLMEAAADGRFSDWARSTLLRAAKKRQQKHAHKKSEN